jgi:iron complex outermembrane receptor protein
MRGLHYLASVAMMTSAAAQAQSQPAEAAPSAGEEGEIIVTAQRRSERLTDVPVSVTAIAPAALGAGGITELDNLTRAAPGILIDRQGAYLQPTIRGVGTNVAGASADPAVAIYVDGVYQPSGTGAFFDLPNVAQVEILKGPQGTLFGRNSTGGAINVTTRDPSFDPSGKVVASYGNQDERSLAVYGTTGLSDTVAVNLSAYYRGSDGWLKDLRTGDDRNHLYSADVRAKVLLKPTETFSFLLNGNFNQSSDPTSNQAVAYRGNTAGRLAPNSGPIATGPGFVSVDRPATVRVKTYTVSGRAELDLDFGTLSSLTSYRHEDGYISGDLDASYAPLSNVYYWQNYRTFTEELILTSPSDQNFTWLAGLYYFKQKVEIPLPGFIFPIPNVAYNSEIRTDAVSGFADATWKLGRFSVFGGLRYSTEEKSFNFGAGAGPRTVQASARFNDLTPRIGVRYALSDNANVYASFNRGFKSGGFNAGSSSRQPIKAERAAAYEVGFKSSSALLTFASAAFYIDYDDIQVTAYDFSQGGISRLFNAAKAEIYGLEVDMTVRPIDGLTVRGAAAYLHARYASFPGAPAFLPRPGGLTGNIPIVGGIDASGVEMIRAPAFTFSSTITYRVPVGSGHVEATLSPYYSSRVNYSFSRRVQQPRYATLDASLAWAPNEAVQISLYGRNLTNKVYASFMAETSSRDSLIFARPRTYGVTIAYNF